MKMLTEQEFETQVLQSAPTILPSVLNFSIGGFGDARDFNFQDGRISYRLGWKDMDRRKPRVVKPTDAQWKEFWMEMDQIGVWEWKAEYHNADICDGVQWELEIRHGIKRIKCYGSNEYPGSAGCKYLPNEPFGKFIQAFSNLTGVKEIHCYS